MSKIGKYIKIDSYNDSYVLVYTIYKMVAADMIFAYVFMSLGLCGGCTCYCCRKPPTYMEGGIIKVEPSAIASASASAHSPLSTDV